jgi:hypothetical protein
LQTSNDEDVAKTYYREVHELLREETGGTRTFIVNRTVRRGNTSTNNIGFSSNGSRIPVYQVHNDYTGDGAEQRVRDLTLQKWFQVYSVWQPLRGPVLNSPPAVLNVRTAAKEDLIPTALIYSDRTGQNYSLKYSPSHRWHYLSGASCMQAFRACLWSIRIALLAWLAQSTPPFCACAEMIPTDVMLMKTYDPHGNEKIAQLAPHSVFKNPLAPVNARPCESIEVRAMVFFA